MSKFEMTKVINFFNYKYEGDWDKVYGAIQRKEKIEIHELEAFYPVDQETKYLAIIDERYPENFKSIYMPPLTIYYAGDINLLQTTNIISLWGDIDEDNLKKVISTNKVVALKVTNENVALAKKLASSNVKFILVDYAKYNQELANELKENNHIIYITEIPKNANNLFEQNANRMLLGISNKSVFFNQNDQEYSAYKKICNFEKREMMLIGKFDPTLLNEARKYPSES